MWIHAGEKEYLFRLCWELCEVFLQSIDLYTRDIATYVKWTRNLCTSHPSLHSTVKTWCNNSTMLRNYASVQHCRLWNISLHSQPHPPHLAFKWSLCYDLSASYSPLEGKLHSEISSTLHVQGRCTYIVNCREPFFVWVPLLRRLPAVNTSHTMNVHKKSAWCLAMCMHFA